MHERVSSSLLNCWLVAVNERPDNGGVDGRVRIRESPIHRCCVFFQAETGLNIEEGTPCVRLSREAWRDVMRTVKYAIS